MYSRYSELSGCEPDDASDIGIRLKVLAGELNRFYEQLEELEMQLFPQSSWGEFLDSHAQLRGLARKKEQSAAGVLRFSRETPAITDLPIPKNSTVSTSSQNPFYYTTSVSGVLKAGKTWAEVAAHAVKPGAGSNLGTNRANVLVNSPTGITMVSNPVPFSGGREKESDQALRDRVLASYSTLSNGINSAYYYSQAIAHNNVKFAKVIAKKRGRCTVDVIISGDSSANQTQVIGEVQAALNSSREITVDVLVEGAIVDLVNLKIELQAYEAFEFEKVAEECKNRLKDFVDCLGIGEPLRLAHGGKALLEVEGVLNIKFISPSGDLPVLENHLIRCGNISVSSWGG